MKRLLFIHAGALGDFVLSLRLLAALRAAGAGHVTILGRPHLACLAVQAGLAHALRDIEVGGFHALFSETADLSRSVPDALREVDTAVSLLTGPGSVCGGRLRQIGVARVIEIDPRPRSGIRGHITDQWLADLATAGLPAEPGPPRIPIEPSAMRAAREQIVQRFGGAVDRLALLHPGSGSISKCWPLAHFTEVILRLKADRWAVAVLLGPVERERNSSREWASLRAAALPIEDVPVADLPALLAAADLYVGNDSGVSHLAAAVGTPAVTIFGPTDPAIWRPLGENVTIVRGPLLRSWPSVRDVLLAASQACRGGARILPARAG